MDEIRRPAENLPRIAGQRGATQESSAQPLTTEEREGLRREVETALLSELEQVGPDALNRARVLRRFEGRGTCRASLFRWAQDLFDSGRAAAAIEQVVRRAGEEEALRSEDPAADAGRAITAMLPRPVTPDDIIGRGALDAIAYIRQCIQTALDVAEHARGPDGRPRNPRLLLQATDSLRKTLETATRLQHAMRDLQSIEEFHRHVLAEVAKESPDTVRRIVRRLERLCATYLLPQGGAA